MSSVILNLVAIVNHNACQHLDIEYNDRSFNVPVLWIE